MMHVLLSAEQLFDWMLLSKPVCVLRTTSHSALFSSFLYSLFGGLGVPKWFQHNSDAPAAAAAAHMKHHHCAGYWVEAGVS
jgi:hypothetical protein